VADRVVAIIPAKARSRRVPGKNMRAFNGRPLVAYTIEAAVQSRLVDDVYVSTDDHAIATFAETCGAGVPFLRPAELAGDDVHSSVPILHMLEQVGGAAKYAFCVQLLPSAPLKTARTIDAIVARSRERAANVLSVTPFGKTLHHLRTLAADGKLERVTAEAAYNFQTPASPGLFYLNGAIYCAPVAALLAHRTFQYGAPTAYVMDELEAIDIDTEHDFTVAERLAALLHTGEPA
jgi:CMP-N,N'-diacetyllegionaminic acid synthase